jgi:CBS domain-containing protein
MICPWCNTDNLPGSDLCDNCLQDLSQLDRPAPHDRVERSLMDDPVALLRPQPPVTLRAEASVGEAIGLMLAQDIGSVLVIDAEEQLLGIFSERDLLTKVAGETDYANRPVRDFMTRRPETVLESDSLAFALHKMDCGGYRHLPVLRDGKLVGIISVRDVMRHIAGICKALYTGNGR